MTSKRIEDHGVIGNECTAALVAVDSSIDFFCFPEFDSPTVFAALLDAEKGGSFTICPESAGAEFRQMYEADSNVLTTRMLSKAATAELTDFMPITTDAQKSQIVRILHVIHGSLTFELRCDPAFDYARCVHKIRIVRNAAVFSPENKNCPPLTLRSTIPLESRGCAAYARFTLQQGERAAFVLGSPDEAANSGVGCLSSDISEINLKCVDKDCADTQAYWRQWISNSTYVGRWREAVNRSALILKLMVSRRHGALIAAPTFGLPEHAGGVRNWDYRFVWIRDAAFTLYAFMRLGLRSEADHFFEWLQSRIANRGSSATPMQIMYGIDGRRQLTEETLDHLSGYCGAKPVRIGNQAFAQLQLDIYGELLDAVYLYSKYGHTVPFEGWMEIQETLSWLGEHWNQPDKGIWEVREGDQPLLHSRLMCWVAFDRAIRLAHKRSLSAPLDTWYRHRDAIVKDIQKNFWSEELKAFTQSQGSNVLDASVLLMPMVRFISPLDPRWLSTLDAVERSLAEGAFVHRYRLSESGDGLEGEEGSFTCCSFWLVECLARSGKIEKAQRHFQRLLAHANHLGLFAEEIGRDGHQLGNFPQALSHLSLISAAIFLDRAVSGARPSPWA